MEGREVMAYALGLVVMLLGLLVSIALHEVGHMVPAKRFGVRVSAYMVGFGPTLWSRTRGETEYGLKAIPLGGYVRLVGMFPPAEVVGARPRAGRVGELVSEVRAASAEEIHPGEEHRAFYRLSTPKKVVVMLGGPLMNLLIAVVLLGAVLMGYGLPAGASTTVSSVSACVLPADAPADRVCTESDPPAPAAAAGLEPGDELLTFAGTPTPTWADFQQAVRAGGGSPTQLVVERDGAEVVLQIDPVLAERPVFDEEGALVLDADGDPVLRETPFVGLTPATARERQPASAVLPAVGDATWQTLGAIVTLPVQLVGIVGAVVGDGERDASGVVGPVGVGRFAGEVAAAEGVSVADRMVSLVSLVAALNIALFAFNLIPLLPLDGGHVAGALWEGARRQVARLRGRSRPAPSDVARMMPLAYGVFIALIVVGVVLLYADLVRPITL
ncbi:M50 family metallopeptidase [Actinotalea soli]|nr:site-2 protease family protein [Actinotalea soli]